MKIHKLVLFTVGDRDYPGMRTKKVDWYHTLDYRYLIYLDWNNDKGKWLWTARRRPRMHLVTCRIEVDTLHEALNWVRIMYNKYERQ